MTRPHGEAGGRPVDLIGQPLTAGRGSRPGVGITRKETAGMAKAEQDGIYTFGRSRIFVRKGTLIPEGAEPVEAPEARKKGPAPENRAEGSAPESRSKKKSE